MSENCDAVLPEVLQALNNCNTGFEKSYGADSYAAETNKIIKATLGKDNIDIFYCFNGTGANNFALSCLVEKYQSVFCSDVSHVYVSESTAPESLTGCRLYPVKTVNGKIVIADLIDQVHEMTGIHCPPAGVLTISQPTEYGTLYSIEELQMIRAVCDEYHLTLHIDGARIFNALVAMNISFATFIEISKPDAITIGGTKAGLMFGEVVVLFRQSAAHAYLHKRSMQLASKNRFVAVQFRALLENDVWKKPALHSNNLARYFAQSINSIQPGCITKPVETNAVFMQMDKEIFEQLQSTFYFSIWNKKENEVRFVFSFSNHIHEIDAFIHEYSQLQKQQGHA